MSERFRPVEWLRLDESDTNLLVRLLAEEMQRQSAESDTTIHCIRLSNFLKGLTKGT